MYAFRPSHLPLVEAVIIPLTLCPYSQQILFELSCLFKAYQCSSDYTIRCKFNVIADNFQKQKMQIIVPSSVSQNFQHHHIIHSIQSLCFAWVRIHNYLEYVFKIVVSQLYACYLKVSEDKTSGPSQADSYNLTAF